MFRERQEKEEGRKRGYTQERDAESGAADEDDIAGALGHEADGVEQVLPRRHPVHEPGGREGGEGGKGEGGEE
jgi:hypothetical protein